MNKTPQKIRFIHSSDWQLGMTRHFLNDEALPRFAQARIDAIVRLGVLATEHDASFIVVSGDVFESNQLSRQTVSRALNALQELPVPVFLLPGNHDPLDATSIFSRSELINAGDNIIVLRDMKPIKAPGLSNVEVVGAPWNSKHPSSDLCAKLFDTLEPAEGIRIAVAHGQTDTLSPDKTRPEIIELSTAEAAINSDLIHYLALGDRHSTTEVGSTGRIWYSGAPVATDFTEDTPNQALLVELDGSSDCVVKPLDIGDWHFISQKFDMNNEGDLNGFKAWLKSLTNKERSVLKIGFTGTVNLTLAAKLDDLIEANAEIFASLKRHKRTTDLTIAPNQFDQDSVTLSGYARTAWEDLLNNADTDHEAQEALRLFYRLSEH